MKWLAVLAGEDLELALEELRSVCLSESSEFSVVNKLGRVILFKTDEIRFSRLAYVREVSRYLDESSIDSLSFSINGLEGSFAVRPYIVEGESEDKRSKLAEKIGSSLDITSRSVDLNNPEHVFRAFKIGGKIILGKRVFLNEGGSFESRRSHLRPFSSPVSLHPRLARCLVNLTRADGFGSDSGNVSLVVDPFCGTGGILVEAGLMGFKVQGSDISAEMVEGSKRNLGFYGVEDYDVVKSDAFKFLSSIEGKVSGVVTDLPYGKSSLKELEAEEMVGRLLDLSKSICSNRIVFVLNRPEVCGLSADFSVYVHKSLSRYIYVVNPQDV